MNLRDIGIQKEGEEKPVNVSGLSSCIAKEICALGTVRTPEQNLLELCKAQEMPGYNYLKHQAMPRGVLQLSAFYIFTGLVNNGHPVTYATGFRDFLLREGLGAVVETEVKENPLYTPPHKVQVFVWSPDAAKVQAWWEGKDAGVAERKEAYDKSEKERHEKYARDLAAAEQRLRVEEARRVRVPPPQPVPPAKGETLPILPEPFLPECGPVERALRDL